ncbi:long-chain-fatty-acid-CoA ligase [Phellopilus nigrolimitatus]|nr:long-chain-fatty-acid-CoA ligase [Phellopilus nigrolimitatus]
MNDAGAPPVASTSAVSSFHRKPKRSVEECEKILTAPGKLHELGQAIIDGRLLRVYKNLPSNTRDFWLVKWAENRDRDYIVFENERYTYRQAHDRASKLASLLYTRYAVRKGDRVAIIMRNLPEFVIIFWATHLLGGVATLINAWAPPGPLLHCISTTNPKVIFVDPERADKLSGKLLAELKQKTSLNKVFVVRAHEGSPTPSGWKWNGMSPLDSALDAYNGPGEAWRATPNASPEDDATIFFTSGTTGLPKGVLSSNRGFLTNVLNSPLAKMRAILRKGENIPEPDPNGPQKGTLISVPLFHVTGLTSALMASTAQGAKVAFIRKWDKEEAARIIVRERLTNAGGVPSMILDLIESSLEPSVLETLSCGGAPSSETMPKEVLRRFTNVESGQGYGLSETNAIAASINDFLARPTSTGLATPVNDLLVVDPATQKVLPQGQIGELWIKGPNIMKGYWGDKAATDKAITPDGWFKTGDLAIIDEEGFVYIKDRIKDIIIREVENALYADERILDAAAVSLPDKRLGELVAAVVTTKPHFCGQVKEEEVIAIAKKSLPLHAVPVMVLVQDELIERNAAGKIVKDVLRKRVRKEWIRRLRNAGKGYKKSVKSIAKL